MRDPAFGYEFQEKDGRGTLLSYSLKSNLRRPVEEGRVMKIQHLRGAALFAVGVASLLSGCAFYFLIIGVFEMAAATISLGTFVALAVIVWTRSKDESTGRGSQA